MLTKRIKNIQGFTLLELIIAVAIVAILAAIAVPSYTEYLKRSSLRSAQADLIALGSAFENSFQRTLSYTVVANTDTLTTVFPGWQPGSDEFAYTAVSTAGTYTLTATGTATRVKDCIVTLDNVNTRAISACDSYNGGW